MTSFGGLSLTYNQYVTPVSEKTKAIKSFFIFAFTAKH